MNIDFDVIVVGAGVGGAAFALALAHAHPLRILLLERHAGPGKVNRGDSLLPAITAHLEAWGALDRCRAAGARRLARMQVFHHRAGLLLETRLDSLGLRHPYLVLPHPEIERVLTEAAVATGRVEVRYNGRVPRLLEEAGRVCGVVVENPDGKERGIFARLIVGADGATSTVRTALGIPLPRIPYEHSYFGIEVSRPDGYEDAMRIELHPDGGVLVVPESDGRVGLGVLVQPREEELFRGGTLEHKMDAIRRRSSLFADCRPFAQGAHLYKLARAHAPRYSARGAVLLGDALHITNPTAGQGMTMAVEDGAALAQHVGPRLADGARAPEIDAALRAYERQRRPANAALIRWSHWMACGYALDGRLEDWLRRRFFALGATSFGQMIQRHIWGRVAARGPGPVSRPTNRTWPHPSQVLEGADAWPR